MKAYTFEESQEVAPQHVLLTLKITEYHLGEQCSFSRSRPATVTAERVIRRELHKEEISMATAVDVVRFVFEQMRMTAVRSLSGLDTNSKT